jgi:hypothetical protein
MQATSATDDQVRMVVDSLCVLLVFSQYGGGGGWDGKGKGKVGGVRVRRVQVSMIERWRGDTMDRVLFGNGGCDVLSLSLNSQNG